MPLMAFAVPLVGGVFCATAREPNTRTPLKTNVKAVATLLMFTLSLRILLPGFVRMIAAKVEELYLRIFVLIHVGVGGQVIRHMIEGHAGRLLAQRVADESQAGSIKRRPHFFDVGMVYDVRLADREWI